MSSRNPEEYKKWWKDTIDAKKQELYEARQRCEIVYLAPEKNPRLPAEETKQEAKIYTVHTQKELEEYTNGLLRRYVLWVDIGTAGLVDKEWLYNKTVEDKLPVALIGCGNTIYAFRDILQLYKNMHGPKIPVFNHSEAFIVYISGMIDARVIDETILEPLMKYSKLPEGKILVKSICRTSVLMENSVFTTAVKETKLWEEICDAVLEGDTVLFIEQCETALILTTRKYEGRAIDEPQAEVEIRAPRDGKKQSLDCSFIFSSVYSLRRIC